MSFEGAPHELRQKAHEAAAVHATCMDRAERLLVNHVLGHAVEKAEDASRQDGGAQRFRLESYGHETYGVVECHLSLSPLPPAPEAPTT